MEVVEPTRLVSWAKDDLAKHFAQKPDLRAAFQLLVGIELSKRMLSLVPTLD